MPVIAMSTEIGTLGDEVAAKLAKRLDIDYADRAFLESRIFDRWNGHKARSGFTPQAPKSHEAACGSATHRSGPLGWVSAITDPLTSDEQRDLAYAAETEISELAAYGNIVFRGWGASAVLHSRVGIFRMRVTASMVMRQRMIGARLTGSDEVAVRRLIETSDRALSTNLEPVLGPGWRCTDGYHVVLDMGGYAVDEAVDVLFDHVTAAIKGIEDDDLEGPLPSRLARPMHRF